MSLDQLMLWRFRNIEGVLANIKSWNITECVFNNGSKITYDLSASTVTIHQKSTLFAAASVKTIPVTECTKQKLITEFGFIERFDNRHALSYEQTKEI